MDTVYTIMTKPWTAALTCSLAFAACTSDQGAGSEPADESAGEKVTVNLLKDPIDVPAFTMTDIDGRTLSTADWRGKVVLVNFWATWCGPCRVEIPDLIALQEKYRDQLVVVGISEEQPDDPNHVADAKDIALIKKFAAERNINYPLVAATPELRKLFPEVMALPTTFVLDREGKLVQKTVGLLNARATEASTRVLAGLSTNAEIVRVEPDKPLGVANVAQVKSIPGVDLASVPAGRKTDALVALNEAACDCGCGLTVARCRIDDPACTVSLPIAKKIVEKFASANP
jgi:cytochrome c biogenesis protein CcmG/thiol:disulfide interchange protein DsbE